MDAFILAARDLSEQLLPTIGLIVLIVIIVLLIKVIGLIKTMEAAVRRTNGTIDLVDQSLSKAQAPLDTVVKLSGTVDKAHDASLQALSQTKEYLNKNADTIKSKFNEVVDGVKSRSKDSAEPVREPSPEDIIGGK